MSMKPTYILLLKYYCITIMLTQASILPVLQTLQTDLEREIHTDTPCKSAQHSSKQLE